MHLTGLDQEDVRDDGFDDGEGFISRIGFEEDWKLGVGEELPSEPALGSEDTEAVGEVRLLKVVSDQASNDAFGESRAQRGGIWLSKEVDWLLLLQLEALEQFIAELGLHVLNNSFLLEFILQLEFKFLHIF